MNRLERTLLGGGLLLVVNSAYLSVAGDPWVFYFANVILHLVLGVGLLIPFARWAWRRRADTLLALSSILLLLGAGLGLALIKLHNTLDMRPLLWSHIAASSLGILGLLAAFWTRRRDRPWRLAFRVVAVCLVAIPAALLFQRINPDPRDSIENRPAPASMELEAMGGADGPFFPSAVHTRNGEAVPSSVYLNSESCARSGCHPDVFDQWESSAHHFSSFNNQWYRKSIEYLQEISGGVTPSKWCGGCHDPAILQSG